MIFLRVKTDNKPKWERLDEDNQTFGEMCTFTGEIVCRFKENAILFFINDPMTVMLANKQSPHNAFDAVYNIITFCVIRSLEYQV